MFSDDCSTSNVMPLSCKTSATADFTDFSMAFLTMSLSCSSVTWIVIGGGT